MKRNVAVVCLLLATGLGVEAQEKATAGKGSPSQSARAVSLTKLSAEKEADIRQLMELSGAKALVVQSMDSMEKNIQPLMTNALPPGAYRVQLVNLFFEKFHAKRDVQKMLDLAVPVYDKHFTNDEIKGLIAFYKTPLGQKAIHTLPQLMAELREEGGNWGRQLGQDCMKEVLAEHPDLAQALEAAAKQQAKPQ